MPFTPYNFPTPAKHGLLKSFCAGCGHRDWNLRGLWVELKDLYMRRIHEMTGQPTKEFYCRNCKTVIEFREAVRVDA